MTDINIISPFNYSDLPAPVAAELEAVTTRQIRPKS